MIMPYPKYTSELSQSKGYSPPPHILYTKMRDPTSQGFKINTLSTLVIDNIVLNSEEEYGNLDAPCRHLDPCVSNNNTK